MEVNRVKRKPVQLIAIEVGPGETISITKDGRTQTGEVLIVDDRPGEGDSCWVLRRQEYLDYYEPDNAQDDQNNQNAQ